MALITCMSEPSTSSTTQKTNQTDEGQIQGPSGHNEGGPGGQEVQEGGQEGGQLRCRHSRGVDDLQQDVSDEEDSGCECSVEELERMDAWTKGGIQSRTIVEIQLHTLNIHYNTHLGGRSRHRCVIYTDFFYFVSFPKTLVAIKESFK